MVMRNTGYECRNCGWSPSWDELNRGSCPGCRSDRQDTRLSLEASLDLLPIGSVLQVFSDYGAPSGLAPAGQIDTIMLWKLVSRDARDPTKARWEQQRGWTEFWTANSDEKQRVYVTGSGYCTPRGQADGGSTAWIIHLTLGEMTYRAVYKVHDLTPSPLFSSDLVRERILNDAFPYLSL